MPIAAMSIFTPTVVASNMPSSLFWPVLTILSPTLMLLSRTGVNLVTFAADASVRVTEIPCPREIVRGLTEVTIPLAEA